MTARFYFPIFSAFLKINNKRNKDVKIKQQFNMAKVNINFNDYKASGVYFLEIDNSIIESVVATSGRLAVGFSKKGPFNAPVYIDNTSDLAEVYGEPDAKLERKGIFFNRSMQTLLKKSPFYALNLVPFEKKSIKVGGVESKVWADFDKVDYMTVGATPLTANVLESIGYPELYDKSRFWKPSTEYLNNNSVNPETKKHNPINIANVGTSDFTLIIRKAEGLKGYDKTARDWYGTEDNIPYAWIRPSDYMSDFFIEVICIEGKWNDEKLALDPFWKAYFEAGDGCSVIKRDKLGKFLKLDAVNVIGDYTGCVIPEFYDGAGLLQSIEPIVNQYTTKTGLLLSVDVEALEENEKSEIDFVGHCAKSNSKCVFGSYDFTYGDLDASIDSTYVKIIDNTINIEYGYNEVDASTGEYKHQSVVDLVRILKVGAMVGAAEGDLAKVIKKQVFPDREIDPSTGEAIVNASYPYNITYTLTDALDSTTESIRLVPSIVDSYDTLTPIVLKGLDIEKKIKEDLFATTSWVDDAGYNYFGEDAALARIYSVLSDKGIERSLLNDDVINFRYLIDTLGHGLGKECGSKRFLSILSKKKQHCLAFLNAPSMTEFANTNLAAYYSESDPYKTFDTSYIPLGGNDNLIKVEDFSLPTEENGAKHVGVFAPYLKYRNNSRTILVPPAADVANAYMVKYDGADPYITVANQDGILNNSSIVGIELPFDDIDRANLEPFGINPIVLRNGVTMIFGDRTAYQEVISDFNYLHVREVLNTIEIECKAVLDRYVFRYNNAPLRAEVAQKLDPILKGMREAGALYNYEIQMDENNNTEEVIDRSFAIVDIGVWVTKNMEKIVTKITVNKLSE